MYELQFTRDSDRRNRRTVWGDDVFSDLELNGPELRNEAESVTLLKAKFKVTFDGDKERAMTIEPPNIATFDRESDNTVIHDWLDKRKFICTQAFEEPSHVEDGSVLEVA